MEKAFVCFAARHSIESTIILRAIRFVGWTMLVARHLLHARQVVSARPSAVLVVALWLATSVEDCRMLRELQSMPPVTHECRKCRNVLLFAMARMMAAILMAPTSLPFTSAQAIAILTGIDMVADNLRLCVALRMLALSCLACCCTLAGQLSFSATPLPGSASGLAAVRGIVAIGLGGFLLPVIALAALELCSRLAFAGLHTQGAEKRLPPRWQALAALLRWPLSPVPQQNSPQPRGPRQSWLWVGKQDPARLPQAPQPAVQLQVVNSAVDTVAQ